ncbi:uncharacterized protein Z520_11836 [Fonsecaea multimorphosa CBS 102226]|uniref:Potassium channel domain-containing protein n=1 Tax=Fonsecaea multimorphosa CBS 102226 TaxID=1442371 RepID=A0A0D2I5H3_9EURO|nr:uncharacterized protein Z520_11836 [Fonsecaea multimorphosa CBS 102226]KIX92516.1 hypothetical protein Z520_11836 [Fonsecaea multimorphosa CBS 102226]OAL19628.1 hypothetical protein AYO22_09790 [Fonsecaea multimorphosa]
MPTRQRSFSYLKGHAWVQGKISAKEDPDRKEEVLRREWFAITVFPLIAGTFGPIASALNICALVRPWRHEINGSGNVPDPAWLIVLNAISLAFGVVANLSVFLLVESEDPALRRHNVQLIVGNTIAGDMASFILVGLVVAACATLKNSSTPQYGYNEAFYYAIFAAILYFITSTVTIYTALTILRVRTSRRDSRVELAKGHHQLMFLTTAFMSYILIGAIIFSHVEGWGYLDAVYWADVTLLTIGFGDLSLQTHLGRSLLFPYAAFGIAFVFFIVFCIPAVVLNRSKEIWAIHLRDRERIKEVQARDARAGNPNADAKYISHSPGDGGLVPIEPIEGAPENDRKAKERQEFELMKGVLLRSAKKRLGYTVGLWTTVWFTLWLIGAVIFWVSERRQHWSYFEAIYFAFNSLLVIGYGDLTLKSDSAKAFFVLWSLIAIPTWTMLVSSIAKAVGNPYFVAQKSWLRRKLFASGEQPKNGERDDHFGKLPRDFPPNAHDRNHLLAKVLKDIIIDHLRHQHDGQKPEYTFEDWEYIIDLMGPLEPLEAADQRTGDLTSPTRTKDRTTEDFRDGDGFVDWLHPNNPMNVTEYLTEWMLITLIEKLEQELLDIRVNSGNVPIDRGSSGKITEGLPGHSLT